MEEKLKKYEAIGQTLKKRQAALHELDAREAAVGPSFQLYQAFKRAIASDTGPGIEAFLTSVPALISDAKIGKYDPDLLLKYVVGALAGGAFDLLACHGILILIG